MIGLITEDGWVASALKDSEQEWNNTNHLLAIPSLKSRKQQFSVLVQIDVVARIHVWCSGKESAKELKAPRGTLNAVYLDGMRRESPTVWCNSETLQIGITCWRANPIVLPVK